MGGQEEEDDDLRVLPSAAAGPSGAGGAGALSPPGARTGDRRRGRGWGLSQGPALERLQRRAVYALRYGELAPPGRWRSGLVLAGVLRASVDEVAAAVGVSGGRLRARYTDAGELEVLAAAASRGPAERWGRRVGPPGPAGAAGAAPGPSSGPPAAGP